MAQYILEIPDDTLETIFSAVCQQKGYDPTSGLTPAEFTRSIVVGYLKQIVVEHTVAQATVHAQQVVDDLVNEAKEMIMVQLDTIT